MRTFSSINCGQHLTGPDIMLGQFLDPARTIARQTHRSPTNR
jgi:hypothetical protein